MQASRLRERHPAKKYFAGVGHFRRNEESIQRPSMDDAPPHPCDREVQKKANEFAVVRTSAVVIDSA